MENDFTHFSPTTLPSGLYADLSHPFGQGYALLAEDIWGQGMSGWTRAPVRQIVSPNRGRLERFKVE